MLDRSAVGQLSSLSSRTKWQRLPADDTLRTVYRLPAIAAVKFLLYLRFFAVFTNPSRGASNDQPVASDVRNIFFVLFGMSLKKNAAQFGYYK